MAVTLRDVAQKAGVSAMTVSRVVNGQARVAPATRRRVEEAVAALGYVPDRFARGLAGRATSTVGLIVPDIANPFFALVVRGAENVAWRAGYHVLLCTTQGDVDRERGSLADLRGFRVAGMLVAPVSDRSASQLRRLRDEHVPFVLVDRSVAGQHGDLVQGDSVAGARALVEHLLRLGHRRVGFITESSAVSTARDRLEGYRQALAGARIPYDPALVREASAIEPGGAAEAAATLLTLKRRPSAIFAVNNLAAVGVAEAARSLGLAIPADLSLACFDDVGLASRLDPFLTVLAQPAETFGTVAMQLLLDRLHGTVAEEGRRVVLPGELLVRASTAPPRA